MDANVPAAVAVTADYAYEYTEPGYYYRVLERHRTGGSDPRLHWPGTVPLPFRLHHPLALVANPIVAGEVRLAFAVNHRATTIPSSRIAPFIRAFRHLTG